MYGHLQVYRGVMQYSYLKLSLDLTWNSYQNALQSLHKQKKEKVRLPIFYS